MGTVIILTVTTSGVFALLLPLLLLSFWTLQKTYRATSRELKRLEAVARSPLLNIFGEFLRGEAVILGASLNWSPASEGGGGTGTDVSPVERERLATLKLLDNSQRAIFTSNMASQWLALRLQYLGIIVFTVLALFSFLLHLFLLGPSAASQGDLASCSANPSAAPPSGPPSGGDGGTATLTGLILSYSIPIVYSLQGLVGAVTDTEREFISMERVQEYMDLPGEDPTDEGTLIDALTRTTQLGDPPAAKVWKKIPHHNGVEFKDVSVAYPPQAGSTCLSGGSPPLALSHVSFTLTPGQSLGVCGRTGSGKSTLLASLWRLVPLLGGKITLGGEDTSQVPLRDLRSLAVIVPQEPLLLKGSIRFNLDPWGVFSDEALWEAAMSCGLAATLVGIGERGGNDVGLGDSPPKGRQKKEHKEELLEMVVEEGGRNLSLGQQQLVCLSRALLRQAPLVALDEAASATDSATDEALGIVLKGGAFKNTTLIVVAHRLSSILGLDRVLVLHMGRVAEFGPPGLLLATGAALGENAREDGPGALYLLSQAAGARH